LLLEPVRLPLFEEPDLLPELFEPPDPENESRARSSAFLFLLEPVLLEPLFDWVRVCFPLEVEVEVVRWWACA